MEIPQSDLEKIKLITVTAQVNDLVALLSNIDKESLVAAIDMVVSEERHGQMYNFLVHALDFYNKIEKELLKEKSGEEIEQFAFKFNE